ncbi:MAG: preprotein translocase subunit YajC, partial [Antricoccus sp.]
MRVLAAASSLSQSLPIILMVALFGGLIYFQMRSRKRMQAQQAAMRSDIAVGTRVVLISGMKATVVRMR